MTSVAYVDGEARTAARTPGAAMFAVAVFASAALVFTVEPLIGKLFLPMLGGSPAIWNTSLAFFQIALLAGYGYAHLLQRLGPVRRQMVVHLGALAVAAVVLPLKATTLLGAPWEGAPALWLACVLALSVGPPFAVLSATAPLLQAWFARLHPPAPGTPDAYALYAASNLGSVLALAAYPVLVEPMIGLSAQARLWSLAYAGFALFLGGLVLATRRAAGAVTAAAAAAPAVPTSRRERLTWMLLAAAPASLLTGVTAHLTADVASAPFLWAIPLELYLVTFVVAFSGRPAGPRPWLLAAQLLAVPAALTMMFQPNAPWPQQIAIHLAAFFVAALVCHQALAARRPPPERLTEFYLWLSIGGVAGGSLNAFVAPLLLPGVWEFPAVLVLATLARPSSARKVSAAELGWLAAGIAWVAPLWIPSLALPGEFRQALMLAPAVIAVMLRDRAWALVLLYGAMAIAGEAQGVGRYREHHRSFFGMVHITEVRPPGMGTARIMVHGTTLHGVQALAPALRCRPTAYYAPGTVIARVFRTEQARKAGLRIGTVGLGAGTVAAFVRAQDRLRFYEIDPLVVRLARDPARFSFVDGCAKGPVDVVTGDARLSLAREPAGAFDLLMIDAFSSDSVPTHLLTVEAIRADLGRLAPDGVLLLHLSNRNLELVGPAAAAVQAAGGHAIKGEHWVAPGVSPYLETAGIVLVAARDPRSLDRYRDHPEWSEPRPTRPWTDDYTNVWGAMIARFRNGPG